MRKQNSEFVTKFISEAGSEFQNNDYFAFVELDDFACYVIADGISTMMEDVETAKLAIQNVILSFQKNPSMKRGVIASYLKEANRQLLKTKSKFHLRASITLVVSDYEKIRYAYVGNTRFRMYRDGFLSEESKDMSLAVDAAKKEELPDDVISRHKERNNLYTYLGKRGAFKPFISKKIKLVEGDIISLYTRGIWENLDNMEIDEVFSEPLEELEPALDNIEDLIFSKQPEQLQNYTFVIISINKVFEDPNRGKKIKKIVICLAILLIIVVIIVVAILVYKNIYKKNVSKLDISKTNVTEYINSNNYVRAKEEYDNAIKLAEKVKKNKLAKKLQEEQKLVETILLADETLNNSEYKEAKDSYVNALDKSKYLDNLGKDYIEQKIKVADNYIAVYEYITLGDKALELGDYENAKENYNEAKYLARDLLFEEGKKEANAALEKLYEEWSKFKEKSDEQSQTYADEELAALQIVQQADQSFSEKDYESAKLYYNSAIEKYAKLGDQTTVSSLKSKLATVEKHLEQKEGQLASAETFENEGFDLEHQGQFLEARKKYIAAKKIYNNYKKDDKVSELTIKIEELDAKLAEQQTQQEQMEETNEETTEETTEEYDPYNYNPNDFEDSSSTNELEQENT